MAPPIVSIVGRSNAGKTTLLEKIIPELIKRGYVVGTIKHDAHAFAIDRPGKDSARHTAAGAKIMVIASKTQAAMVRKLDREMTVTEIVDAYMGPVDIVLTEGFKGEAQPKIEVLADGDRQLLSPPGELILIAAAQAPSEIPLSVPLLGRDDTGGIVDLIEAGFLKNGAGRAAVELVVDGRVIPLNRIMQVMVDNTVRGLVAALKGVDKRKSVTVRLADEAEKLGSVKQ